MRLSTLLVFTATAALVTTTAAFNYSKCPAFWELQTPRVAANFTLDRFQGSYYELALHDWTQKPACPKPSCVQSQKVVDRSVSPILIADHWSLECFGARYRPMLFFNYSSEHPGVMSGFSKLVPGTVFPNTVVDFQYNATSDRYVWVIELQCMEKLGHVWFVGINFYVRTPHLSPGAFDALLNAGRAQGIGMYMDNGQGLFNVSQDNCTYDPPPTTKASR